MRSWWSWARRWPAIGRRWNRPADAWLLLRVFCFALVVPALFRLKLSRLQALLEPAQPGPTPNPEQTERIIGAVDAALRWGWPLVRRGCLTRGATRYYFLRRAGLSVALQFGMGRVEGQFAGHCWLVKDDEPFLESKDPRPYFAPIYRVGAGGLSCTG